VSQWSVDYPLVCIPAGRLIKENTGDDDADKLGKTEVIRFPQDCPNCHAPGEVVNAITDIPGFKVRFLLFTFE